MNTIPKTDSIRKLSEFWDTHDLTDFFDELEEVTEPVFTGRDMVMEIHLSSDEAEKVRKIAKFQGIGVADLIHEWIVEQAYLIQRKRKIVFVASSVSSASLWFIAKTLFLLCLLFGSPVGLVVPNLKILLILYY